MLKEDQIFLLIKDWQQEQQQSHVKDRLLVVCLALASNLCTKNQNLKKKCHFKRVAKLLQRLDKVDFSLRCRYHPKNLFKILNLMKTLLFFKILSDFLHFFCSFYRIVWQHSNKNRLKQIIFCKEMSNNLFKSDNHLLLNEKKEVYFSLCRFFFFSLPLRVGGAKKQTKQI